MEAITLAMRRRLAGNSRAESAELLRALEHVVELTERLFVAEGLAVNEGDAGVSYITGRLRDNGSVSIFVEALVRGDHRDPDGARSRVYHWELELRTLADVGHQVVVEITTQKVAFLVKQVFGPAADRARSALRGVAVK